MYLSGYQEDELKGVNIRVIKSGEHDKLFYDTLWNTIESGNVWRGEFHNRAKNGDLYWEDCFIFPFIDNEGIITNYISIRQDISEQKSIKSGLAKSEKRFQDLADLLFLPVFETNIQGIISYANRAGLQLFGYSAEDIHKNFPFTAFIAPEDHEKAIINWKNRLSENDINNSEYTGIKKNGTRFPYIVYSAAIKQDNEVIGIRGVGIDITERKELENKLQHLNETLETKVLERTIELEQSRQQIITKEKLASIGQLAAGIAHEINNPLNFVQINITNIENDFNDLYDIFTNYQLIINAVETGQSVSEEISKLRDKEKLIDIGELLVEIPKSIKQSQNGIERITTITRSMRNFSFKNKEDQLVLFDINKAIQDALVMSKHEYNQIARIELELQNIPFVLCNPSQINQVILNLVMNSINAIKTQIRELPGYICIKTWAFDNTVYCSVIDNGPGIPEENRHQIFEPFFTTNKTGTGTGLGLSISYDIIVHKHEGSFSFECPPGGGTVFTLSIPVKRKSNN